MGNECIFCKIVAGEIPSKKLYEDEKFLAFLDIRPASKGHTLVIPKAHSETFLDMPDADEKEMFAVVQKLGKKLKNSLNAKLIFLLVMGEEVAHTHVHLLPFYGEEFPVGLKGSKEMDLDTVLEEINAEKEG